MNTQYYGAELQDVQVQVEVRRNNVGSTTTGGQVVTTFVFNQKVLADTYTVKSTQPSNKPVPLSTTNIVLNYTPIILQRGKGGPVVGDPIALVESFYPDYKFTAGARYLSTHLTKIHQNSYNFARHYNNFTKPHNCRICTITCL